VDAIHLSNKYCLFIIGNTLISLHDMGDRAYIASNSEPVVKYFDTPILGAIQLSDSTVYIYTNPRLALGTAYTLLAFTHDGGKTFEFGIHATGSDTSDISGTVHNGKLFICNNGQYHDNYSPAHYLGDLVMLKNVYHYYLIYKGFGPSSSTFRTYRGWVSAPYFEGDVGVWQAAFTRTDAFTKVEDNTIFYMYYISLDSGTTWTIYDPSSLVEISDTLKIVYHDIR